MCNLMKHCPSLKQKREAKDSNKVLGGTEFYLLANDVENYSQANGITFMSAMSDVSLIKPDPHTLHHIQHQNKNYSMWHFLFNINATIHG